MAEPISSPEYLKNQAEAFREALLSSDEENARLIFEEAKDQYSPLELVETIVVPALDDIGTGWANNQYALSQVYMSGRICENVVDAILPPESGMRKARPKMAIALLNDYHALGKRIVYATLRAGGYQVRDYGRVEADELVERVIDDELDLVLISVLMLTSAMNVKEVSRELRKRGATVKIAVGGAPFRLDPHLWQVVEADVAGVTASDALSIANDVAEGLSL